MSKLLLVAVISCMLSTLAFAGGSHQTVDLLHVSFFGDTKFVLTVRPRPDIDGYEDNYFRDCDTFVVIGEHRPLGVLESGYMPKIERHLDTLRFLKTKPSRFKLGYIGGGFFVPDTENKCVVESRALDLMNEESVLSWFTGT